MPVSALRRRLLGALSLLPAAGLLRSPLVLADASPGYVLPGPVSFKTADATWHDATRSRDVPVRIRAPQSDSPMPLLLFSHGLGGSVAGGALWADHWASHGYLVINVQHPGSDESLWRGGAAAGDGERRADFVAAGGAEGIRRKLKAGMNAKAFIDRVQDIHFVLDQAGSQRARSGGLVPAFDTERIGMSGHSFGAWTTLAVCGERGPGGESMADPRIRAGLAFSPTAGPESGREQRFAGIRMPMLVVTGTQDSDMMGTGATPETRRATFAAMSPPDKYMVVLEGAQHMNFGGGARANASGKGPHYTAAVDAISLAYWNAMLRGDAAARAWLANGTRSVLDAGDVFSAK